MEKFIIQCLIHLAYKTLCNVVSEKPDTLIYIEVEKSSNNPLCVVRTSIINYFQGPAFLTSIISKQMPKNLETIRL